MRKLILPLLLSSALTVSCSQAPAGFKAYGVQKGAGSTGIHTVLQGDTVYTIAENYQLPMREIITLNDIQAPYVLKTGFRMKLPPPNEYQAREGDSIFTISKLYEVSPNRLAELNNLKPPYKIQRGQVLRLPTPTLKQEAMMRENLARQERDAPTVQTARLGSIERENLDAPATQNSSAAGNVDMPPQPQANGGISRTNVEKAVLTPDTARDGGTDAVTPGRKPEAKNAPVKLEEASTTTRANIPTTTPKLSGQGKYMRPVSGRVISSFGPKADGLHNDGINIKAARGTPVRSAENGVVVYAGDDLAGYGNLILIRHQGKIMTAYAHLDKMLVEKGATVERGQSIGTVGSTGQVESPQLHFEVRKGSTPINPDNYL